MYIAKKRCQFSGKPFLIGEVIPDEFVLKVREADLVKLGVIDRVPSGESVDSKSHIKETEENIEADTGDNKRQVKQNKKGSVTV